MFRNWCYFYLSELFHHIIIHHRLDFGLKLSKTEYLKIGILVSIQTKGLVLISFMICFLCHLDEFAREILKVRLGNLSYLLFILDA